MYTVNDLSVLDKEFILTLFLRIVLYLDRGAGTISIISAFCRGRLLLQGFFTIGGAWARTVLVHVKVLQVLRSITLHILFSAIR